MAVSLFNTNNSAELQVLPELEFSFNTLPQTLTGSLLKFVSDYNVGVSLLEKLHFIWKCMTEMTSLRTKIYLQFHLIFQKSDIYFLS